MQFAAEAVHLVGGNDDRGIRLDDRPVVGRIQALEFLDRHVGQVGSGFYVDRPRAFQRREIGLVRNEGQAKPGNQRSVAENVLQGLQFRDVMPCFVRHVQAGIVGGQTARFVLDDGPFDGTFAPVVRGQRQMPVAVHVVDGLQVVERGIGRGDDVAAFVAPPVLFEIETLAGGRDELP